MLCVLCLIVLWGFSLVTSYSGVIDRFVTSLDKGKQNIGNTTVDSFPYSIFFLTIRP